MTTNITVLSFMGVLHNIIPKTFSNRKNPTVMLIIAFASMDMPADNSITFDIDIPPQLVIVLYIAETAADIINTNIAQTHLRIISFVTS